jgi:hypothetical protein
VAGAPSSDDKRVVCSALTNALRASVLKDAIDPNAFFMMVNANFALIYKDGTVDLGPLWDPLAAGRREEDLFVLFLKFGEAARDLGLQVQLPPRVRSGSGGGARTPPPAAKTPPPPVRSPGSAGSASTSGSSLPAVRSSQGTPAPLASSLAQEIAAQLVNAFKTSPAAPKLNLSAVQAFVLGRFEELFDGKRFDINPILGAVMEIGSISEAEIYVGIVRFKSMLLAMDIEMVEPALTLDPATRARLVSEAQSETLVQPAVEPKEPRKAPKAGIPPSAFTDPKAPSPRTEQRLEQFGLKGQPAKKRAAIRTGVLAGVGVALIAAAWLMRPVREIDLGPYGEVFPLVRVRIIDGIFVGRIDEGRWASMDATSRNVAMKKLEAVLKTNGYLDEAHDEVTIVDSQGRMVVFDVKGEKLEIAAGK